MVLDLGLQPAYRHDVYPDENGRFGAFGGRYVPEGLMPALLELEQAYRLARADPAFGERLATLLRDRVGRPTRLHAVPRFAASLGVPGLKVYLKREDMAHTGSHKINNALGQALLAQRLGKTRIVAETGAGQHGGAVAAVCAMLGLECVIYMGGEDVRRQPATVARMRMLGAEVRPVESGNRRVKEAISASVRDWVANLADTHLLLGTVVGPAPYPQMVRDFQTVIGREARADILRTEGRLPDLVLACVGGGSNALGLFHPFAADPEVELVAVEAAGRGAADGDHAATLTAGSPGEVDGTFSYLLQDADGQIAATHSIAAGLDYPGVGPELGYLRDSGRMSARTATDAVALRGLRDLSRTEGVLAGLESAHAVGHLMERAEGGELARNTLVVLCLSGSGDKDLAIASERLAPGS
ncbi:tryptophan synthase subunit beta [Nocardia cyriacigeorgica]|uniref:tryptophan synthase subunit beta n=2 Tax=Nocardia cyriacigeorgica TaxID=135487 RepID=UPI00189597E4|nr:tryptophan synthase subunit beta [Nocardia cyriacigeorgica]MBF6435815.1 tryptophan synthase subunit beta [Nocardia cyriacigeorgica]MBF6454106.1 tryptophan synthase subunit beta [Nocardia cyriacigeorgica]MBF6552000.1 tryptophan synthase subunit beta [Nocardia cyriacigeorgica]